MQAQGANLSPAQHLDRPGANPLFTAANAMFICDIDSPTLFQGDSQAKQIAREVFNDDFVSWMDKIVKQIRQLLKVIFNTYCHKQSNPLKPGTEKKG